MKYSVAPIIFCFLFSTLSAQDFESTFEKFNGSYVPERIHFHFDKTSYVAGDTVWFKAYLQQGILPSRQSKSLYIDWTDQQGTLITRTQIPVVEGVTYGQIEIPAAYPGNFVHMKAYTKWMLNFDSAFLYNRDIRVIPSGDRKSLPTELRYDLHLFPEGGTLISGLNQKIAFKATDQYGRPAKITGELRANGASGQKLVPVHDGMGYFFLIPQRGTAYEVAWKDPAGKSHRTVLPESSVSGIALQIKDNDAGGKIFSVASNDPELSRVHLIGTMYHQAVFSIARDIKEGAAQGLIPTDNLPSGILTITALDAQYRPIAERITFINNGEYKLEAEMNVRHWGLNKRARNEVEISIPGNRVFTHMSVSVTDNQIDFDTTNSIVSDLLLTGELKGKVYRPDFYFSLPPDSVRDKIDLLMLTHGWRKIAWSELAAGRLPAINYPADTLYQTISGQLYGARSTQLANAGDIVLIVNQKERNEWVNTPIRPDGTFRVENFMLFDTATVYYQPPKNKQLGNVTVQFMQDRLPAQPGSLAGNKSWLPEDTSGAARHFMLSQAMQDELKFFEGKVLEDVTIVGRTKSAEDILDESYTSGMFSGGHGRGFDLRDDVAAMSAQNIFQYLQGRVAGVNITMSNPPQINWRGGAPALFLNEMPVDAEMLSSIPVSDIAYVKVINPPFLGASGGGNGAIAIYTRKGDDFKYESGKGLNRNTITGYSVIRQFYSPDYDRYRDEKKDLRTTLYWNPEVILQPGESSTVIKFFNNDVTEAFRVVIEGMSADGKMTRVVQIME